MLPPSNSGLFKEELDYSRFLYSAALVIRKTFLFDCFVIQELAYTLLQVAKGYRMKYFIIGQSFDLAMSMSALTFLVRVLRISLRFPDASLSKE